MKNDPRPSVLHALQLLNRALRRAGRAAAAGIFKTPPPKFGIGASNAAAADNLWSPPA